MTLENMGIDGAKSMSFKQRILGGKRKFLVAGAAVTLLLIFFGVVGALTDPVLEGGSPVGAADEQRGSVVGDTFRGDYFGRAVRTGVFLNGQELSLDQVYSVEGALRSDFLPGRYWLDDMGNYGLEGGPAIGNVYGGQTGGGGNGLQRTSFGDVGGGSFYDPQTGCSYVPGGGVSC